MSDLSLQVEARQQAIDAQATTIAYRVAWDRLRALDRQREASRTRPARLTTPGAAEPRRSSPASS